MEHVPIARAIRGLLFLQETFMTDYTVFCSCLDIANNYILWANDTFKSVNLIGWKMTEVCLLLIAKLL